MYDTNKEAIYQASLQILSDITGDTDLFISGGSSFEVFSKLNEHLAGHKKFVNIYQVDERYGEVDHDNSNWNMLSGIDTSEYNSLHPMLKPGLDKLATEQNYTHELAKAISSEHKKIAILGFGDDSHVAGIKPMIKTDFAKYFYHKLVSYYSWSDFERITLTYSALMKFDSLVVFGHGHKKLSVIDNLQTAIDDNLSPIHGLLKANKINIYFSKEG